VADNENGSGKRAWMAIISGAAVLVVGVFGWVLSVTVAAQSRLSALEVRQESLQHDMDNLSGELRETRSVMAELRVEIRETRAALARDSDWRPHGGRDE